MRKIVFILFVALLLSLAVGAGTNRGLQWMIAAADRMLPAEISVSQVNGSLLGPMDLRGVRYSDGTREVRIDSLDLDWRPTALFVARLHVKHLHADGIEVRALQASQESDGAPASLQLPPVSVSLDDVAISNIRVWSYGVTDATVIDRLQLAAELDDVALEVHSFSLDARTFAARLQGLLPLDAIQAGTITTDWWLQLPELPKLVGKGALQGNVRELQIEQDISGPGNITLRATLEDVLEDLRWNAAVDLDDLKIQLLQPEGPARILDARLAGGGGLATFMVEGKAQLTDSAFGSVDADLYLSRSGDRWQLQRLDLLNPQHPGLLHITGELGADGRLNARAHWNDLSRQLSGQQKLHSPSGELILEGRLDDYQFRSSALLESTGYPVLALSLQGTGDLERLELQTLRGESTQAAFDASAAVTWTPVLEWTMQARATDFDPAFFMPGRAGKLSFRLQSEGRRHAEGLQGRLQLDEVGGTLQGQAVSGSARVRFRGDRLDIQDSYLAVGAARLSASGRVDSTWEFDWEANVPDLGLLQKGTSGALQGRGRLSGPRAAPVISASLAVSGLNLPDFRLESLRADINMSADERHVSKLAIKGEGLEVKGQRISSLSMEGEGMQSGHDIRFALQQERRELAGDIAARLHEGAWSGTLDNLRLVDADIQSWVLQRPVEFSAARNRGTFDPLCLAQAEARLCVAGNWQAIDWNASLDGENLPLSLLKPWLQRDIAMQGTAGLQVRARAQNSALSATGELVLAPGSVTLKDGKETLALAQFGEGLVKARLQDNALDAELGLALQDNGHVNGRLRLGNLDSRGKWFSDATTVASDLRLHFMDNGLVSLFAPGVSATRGQIDADLVIGGTLGNPLFEGAAAVKNGELSLVQPGIRLANTNLQVRGDGNTLKVTGTASSGEGEISVEGRLALRKGVLSSLDLDVSGENFQLLSLPEATLAASPDLKLTLRDKRLDINGKVRVPSAAIRLVELKGVARESGDLVLVHEDVPTVPAEKYQLHSHVTLLLEDKVAFSGFGLNGTIKGKLDILEEPGKVTRGQGELDIVDGSYKLYGKKLDIEKGRLVFAGGPIGNPGLDIQVVRKTGNVLAGVRVGGSAETPRMNLFSEPAMEQSDILSYLLLGVPTSRASGAQGATLAGAAASLGLAGGDLLAGTLGNAFGIEEMRIESGDTLQESSLVLGKFLSPRLFISYAIGLFDPANIFRMRYTLSRRWALQTEAGIASGADLLYSLEND